MSDRRKYDSVGSGWLFGCFTGRRVCFIQQKKEVQDSESRFCNAESVSSSSFCRTCAEWLFLRVQPVDLGIWNADSLYLCKNISGPFYFDIKRKKENVCDFAGVLWVGTFLERLQNTEKSDGSSYTEPFRFCDTDLWNCFCKKEKSDDHAFRTSYCRNRI